MSKFLTFGTIFNVYLFGISWHTLIISIVIVNYFNLLHCLRTSKGIIKITILLLFNYNIIVLWGNIFLHNLLWLLKSSCFLINFFGGGPISIVFDFIKSRSLVINDRFPTTIVIITCNHLIFNDNLRLRIISETPTVPFVAIRYNYLLLNYRVSILLIILLNKYTIWLEAISLKFSCVIIYDNGPTRIMSHNLILSITIFWVINHLNIILIIF